MGDRLRAGIPSLSAPPRPSYIRVLYFQSCSLVVVVTVVVVGPHRRHADSGVTRNSGGSVDKYPSRVLPLLSLPTLSLLLLVLPSSPYHSSPSHPSLSLPISLCPFTSFHSLLFTRSTQPCIPPGSLNRAPASAGVRAGMSPLPGGR